jgi:hypothetical protein
MTNSPIFFPLVPTQTFTYFITSLTSVQPQFPQERHTSILRLTCSKSLFVSSANSLCRPIGPVHLVNRGIWNDSISSNLRLRDGYKSEGIVGRGAIFAVLCCSHDLTSRTRALVNWMVELLPSSSSSSPYKPHLPTNAPE